MFFSCLFEIQKIQKYGNTPKTKRFLTGIFIVTVFLLYISECHFFTTPSSILGTWSCLPGHLQGLFQNRKIL